MLRCFQVAGLVFSLDLPDGHPAADLLHNYDPFETGKTDSPLFTLTVTDVPPAGA